MTILTIRKHQRFAVRNRVCLTGGTARARDALLVEISLDGCRLSLTETNAFTAHQALALRIDGYGSLSGTVRWAGDGYVGLRFDAPLHNAEFIALLQACRPETSTDNELRAYGT